MMKMIKLNYVIFYKGADIIVYVFKFPKKKVYFSLQESITLMDKYPKISILISNSNWSIRKADPN